MTDILESTDGSPVEEYVPEYTLDDLAVRLQRLDTLITQMGLDVSQTLEFVRTLDPAIAQINHRVATLEEMAVKVSAVMQSMEGSPMFKMLGKRFGG
jgi:hypothetical protein